MDGILLLLRIVLCCPASGSKLFYAINGCFVTGLFLNFGYYFNIKINDRIERTNIYYLSIFLLIVKHVGPLAIIRDLRANQRQISRVNGSLKALESSLSVQKKGWKKTWLVVCVTWFVLFCIYLKESRFFAVVFGYFYIPILLFCLLLESYAICACRILDQITLLFDQKSNGCVEFEDALRLVNAYKALYKLIREATENFGITTFFVLFRIKFCLALGCYYVYVLYNMTYSNDKADSNGYDFIFELLFVPIYGIILKKFTTATYALGLSWKNLALKISEVKQQAKDPRVSPLLVNLELFMHKHVVGVKFKGDKTPVTKGVWFGVIQTIQNTALVLKDLREKGF